jgi:hypothetical protein
MSDPADEDCQNTRRASTWRRFESHTAGGRRNAEQKLGNFGEQRTCMVKEREKREENVTARLITGSRRMTNGS